MTKSDREQRFHDEKWDAITNALRLAREVKSDIFDMHIALASVEGRLEFLTSDCLGKPVIEGKVPHATAESALRDLSEVNTKMFSIMDEFVEKLESKLLPWHFNQKLT